MIKNKKILVLGMARSGTATAKLLAKYNNEIVITDMKEQEENILKELNELNISVIITKDQENLLNDLINIKGEEAYQSIAKPGFSEHQTGLAVDIGFYQNSYYDEFFEVQNYVAEFHWLEENAFKYGFIIRYPKNKEDTKKNAPKPEQKKEEVFWAEPKSSSLDPSVSAKKTVLQNSTGKLFKDNVSFHIKK